MRKLISIIAIVFFLSGLHWTSDRQTVKQRTYVAHNTVAYERAEQYVIMPLVAEVSPKPVQSENAKVLVTCNTAGDSRSIVLVRAMHPT